MRTEEEKLREQVNELMYQYQLNLAEIVQLRRMVEIKEEENERLRSTR